MFRGVFPPITTPFDAAGALDTRALAANASRWMRSRLAGLVVLGSNGEAPFLDEEESVRAIEAARGEVPRGRTLIAGAGREGTRTTIEAVRRAAAAGADAVLVRTPSYFKIRMTTDVLVAHYLAVADASPVPVILYNFPAVTGINMLPAAIERLARHGNIAGVKESGADVDQIAQDAARTPAAFTVFAGSALVLQASLLAGASGAILAPACVVPDLCVELYEIAVAGRHDEARALQRKLTPLTRLVTATYGVPGLKVALDLVGFAGGPPRAPLAPAPPEAADAIRAELAALGVIELGSSMPAPARAHGA
jgi:4-hydroxy-2-oxoglutarate aldolase